MPYISLNITTNQKQNPTMDIHKRDRMNLYHSTIKKIIKSQRKRNRNRRNKSYKTTRKEQNGNTKLIITNNYFDCQWTFLQSKNSQKTKQKQTNRVVYQLYLNLKNKAAEYILKTKNPNCMYEAYKTFTSLLRSAWKY